MKRNRQGEMSAAEGLTACLFILALLGAAFVLSGCVSASKYRDMHERATAAEMRGFALRTINDELLKERGGKAMQIECANDNGERGSIDLRGVNAEGLP